MNEPLYKPGQKYQLDGRTIEIYNHLVFKAKDEYTRYYDDHFYIIFVLPENIYCIIQENKLRDGIIVPYLPTIGRRGSKGCIVVKHFPVQYKIWQDMIYRCYYPNNRLYQAFGALGTTVNAKWMCFEYFLYDWEKIPGSGEALRDAHSAYAIDFNSAALSMPIEDRMYNLDNCVIVKFGYSQVAQVYNCIKIKEAKQSRRPNKSGGPILIQNTPNNKSGDYTAEDYERVIKNPQLALAGYVDPADIVEKEINPLYGPISPVVEPREPGKKIMCVIVPDDIRKQHREK